MGGADIQDAVLSKSLWTTTTSEEVFIVAQKFIHNIHTVCSQ